MAKLPTRSPTHDEVDPGRLAAIGLELDDVADGERVALRAVIELAEDRGRPASHYVAAIPLATELALDCGARAVTARVCAGNCQRYGALPLMDHLIERHGERVAIAPVECLDRCDHAPACELHGAHGVLVLAPATPDALDEALGELGR